MRRHTLSVRLRFWQEPLVQLQRFAEEVVPAVRR
jgi:hypothetical protein